jgi:fructokinase
MGNPAPPQVLCFGEALVDRLEGGGLSAADHLGGAPANVACALARLGIPVAFLGRLGRDGPGRSLAALLQERGVDSSGLQWDPQRPTRVVRVRREPRGERRFDGFVGERGAGFADQAVELQPLLAGAAPLLERARWLLVGTLAMASPATAAAQAALVAAAAAAGVGVAVDLNWRPSFWGLEPDAPPPPGPRQAIAALLEHADLIKAAAEEAAWLFGAAADPAATSAGLPRRPAVLITDGPLPVRWWWPAAGGCGGEQPAFPLKVVDTTGAGDAFTAGLLYQLCARPAGAGGALPGPGMLAQGGPGKERVDQAAKVAFAAACGALTCRGEGAITPQPTAAEVASLLAGRPAGPA